MKIPILIEVTPEQRYRASAGEPFAGSVEGDSPEAVLEQMKARIDDRVAHGALIAAIELPDGENPWLSGVGMFRDDPLFESWQQAIADYRREANSLTDAP
jgi:hypothetical protein